LAALPLAGFLSWVPARAAEDAVRLPPAAVDIPGAPAAGPQTAILSGGCFWGVQGVFQHVNGVQQVVSGYAGGSAATANYGTVSTGVTGHAESVQIRFDPSRISYGQILQIFFSVALDPTQVNRQGPDVGTQYRSEIFYADADQQRVAQAYIAQLNQAKLFHAPIATRLDPAAGFFPAEAYHQDYLVRHPNNPYIATFDQPKIANLKRLFPEQYHETPTTTVPNASSS
jgi:peptide-methionine (S)-S-oxide reductase